MTKFLHVDDESGTSDGESDHTVAPPDVQPEFVDIGHRPSSIQCSVSPGNLLDAPADWPGPDHVISCNALLKSVHDKDSEAFTQIADLYRSLPEPLQLPSIAIEQIIKSDKPDMLDEFIRLTGLGIDITREAKEPDEDSQSAEGQVGTYLGLSVHGKKRKDLARMNVPDNCLPVDGGSVPAVWTAAHNGAIAIVDYLSGKRPLAAYQYYISNHDDERAQRLRRISDLEETLPIRLGWKISSLGESPLTSAILGKTLSVTKDLFAKHPDLMELALHQR